MPELISNIFFVGGGGDVPVGREAGEQEAREHPVRHQARGGGEDTQVQTVSYFPTEIH